MTAIRPWYRHPIDLVLVVSFAGFFVTSVVFDRLAALDLVRADSSDPIARALWQYGAAYDPLVAQNPVFLRVMSWISAFVFGPFYLVLVYALVRRRTWIRVPAIIYASCILYSMIVHVVVELMWPEPPPDLVVFAFVYGAYAIAPTLLLVRMAPDRPFG